MGLSEKELVFEKFVGKGVDLSTWLSLGPPALALAFALTVRFLLMLKNGIDFLKDAKTEVVAKANSFLGLTYDANIKGFQDPLGLPVHFDWSLNRQYEVLLLAVYDVSGAEHDNEVYEVIHDQHHRFFFDRFQFVHVFINMFHHCIQLAVDSNYTRYESQDDT